MRAGAVVQMGRFAPRTPSRETRSPTSASRTPLSTGNIHNGLCRAVLKALDYVQT
jgi:hypothetical protein